MFASSKSPRARVFRWPRTRFSASFSVQAETPPEEIRTMTDYRVAAGEAQEDQVTAAIEKVTSQVPSSIFLGAAIASIIGSVALQASKKQHEALFVGQWVAPFLILGLYNKMVKQHGSDATSNQK
jgi:hypothetical protein